MNDFPAGVKVCGITHIADAELAVRYGADYLGFVFVPESSRYVTPEQAKTIIRQLPAGVRKIGVFVDYSDAAINGIIDECGLDIAQLHGDEPPEVAVEVGESRVWKMCHLTCREDMDAAMCYPAAALLVDSVVAGRRGGTGTVGNWELAAKLALAYTVVLAGGLHPGNVAEAIRTVRPFAVDVCSGVEQWPGRKDPEKLKAFIAAAKAAFLAFPAEATRV